MGEEKREWMKNVTQDKVQSLELLGKGKFVLLVDCLSIFT